MSRFDPRPVARQFWQRAGVEEPFPRSLSPTIAAILPVAVVFLPRLSVGGISEYLTRRGAGCFSGKERRLRGCVVAQRGHAFVFIDGELHDDEKRLTLGHETAHFIHHYEAPRKTAIAHLGEAIVPVLDGERLASPSEHLLGALRGVPIGVYEHALDRGDDGMPDAQTSELEAEADLIAFELLAPTKVVLRETEAGADRTRALVEKFGLPRWAADRWARWVDSRNTKDSFIAHLEAARGKKVP